MPAQGGVFAKYLGHGGMVEAGKSHGTPETKENFSIGQCFSGWVGYFAQVGNPSFGIGHCSFFFEMAGSRQHQVGEWKRLVLIGNILHHYETRILDRKSVV